MVNYLTQQVKLDKILAQCKGHEVYGIEVQVLEQLIKDLIQLRNQNESEG